MHTADELGIGSDLQHDYSVFSTPPGNAFSLDDPAFKRQQEEKAAADFARLGRAPRTPEEAGDTMVQTGILGLGAGALAAPVLRALGAGPAIQSIGAGAASGGVSSKTAGGDFTTGAVIGGAIPAVSAGANTARRFVSGAPARTSAAAKQGITTGEQNAGKRLTERFRAAGGKDDQFINDLLERHPELERMAAIKGRTNPARVGTIVDDLMDAKGSKLDDMYETMAKDKRLVKPADIAVSFDKRIGDALAAGDQTALRILRQERSAFMREYKNFGALSPETMRGLKRTAGKTAFGGAPVPAEVRQDIWRTYADAVEKQAVGSGVDVAAMRELNKDMQILGSAKTALDERAVMQKAGRQSIGEIANDAAALVAGDGNILKKIALRAGVRQAGEAARRVDSIIARGQRGKAPPTIVDMDPADATMMGAALGVDGAQGRRK